MAVALIQDTLLMPDERQLNKGITSTDVPALLRTMVDSLVAESTRIEDGYVLISFILSLTTSY